MNLPKLEELFFNLSSQISEPAPVFIVGSPRTGSTPLYQAVASAFSLPYISNFVNDQFAQFPIVGFALQRGVQTEIEWKNEFGKTKGEFQLSEGSAVMSRWFGGGHPSQLVSNSILDGQEEHFFKTLEAVEFLYGKPILIKNAWNCFRIKYLASRLPKAKFIWIRRDISAAAKSDLLARHITKNNPNEWNSATPANVDLLKRLPPAHQVVENQFEFNKAIEGDLHEYAVGRWLEVWYEDFIAHPEDVMRKLGDFLICGPTQSKDNLINQVTFSTSKLSIQESKDIEQYVKDNTSKLLPYSYASSGISHACY